jgi:hypothetical protein
MRHDRPHSRESTRPGADPIDPIKLWLASEVVSGLTFLDKARLNG